MEGATVPAGAVNVTVAVTNFALTPPGGANAAGRGHIHYYLDVAIPTTPGQVAFSAAGTYKASPGTSVTWELSPGIHTLGVQLVNNDHTPLIPPVTAQVRVTVAAPVASNVTTPPPKEVKVSMKDFLFIPAKVTINIGDKVTWINDDVEPHTVSTRTWDSGTINAGQSYSRTFDTAGTIVTLCVFHPTMVGEVIVVKPGG